MLCFLQKQELESKENGLKQNIEDVSRKYEEGMVISIFSFKINITRFFLNFDILRYLADSQTQPCLALRFFYEL